MGKTMLELDCMTDLCDLTFKMWDKGWDEGNGGNVSILLDEDEAEQLEKYPADMVRTFPIRDIPDNVRGRYFVVTATGSFFQHIKVEPQDLVGVVHIPRVGDCYEIVAGYEAGGKPTVEFESHLRSHASRLAVDPSHHVIMHNHSTGIVTMTHCGPTDEKGFTVALWRMVSESILKFPEGIGFMPWCVCGTEEIGIATAEKMKNHRVVVWQYHGVLSSGSSLRNAYGLLEIVDKAAEVYVGSHACAHVNPGISDAQLQALADARGIKPHEGYLG